MKFAIAGILIALAVCASSAIVPLAYSAVPYAHGSYAHHVAVAPVVRSYAAPITQYSSVDVVAHSPVAYHAPAVAYHAPAVAYHAAPVVAVAHGPASYTAATRGAVHNAPLEGHAVSQTSLNLAPAPGTL